MKNKLLLGIAGIILAVITACNNPFLPARMEISVNPEVPVISVQPRGAEYITGDSAKSLILSASVSDKGKLSYQWFSNDKDDYEDAMPLPNETGETYTPPTETTGIMYYYAEVANTLKGKTAIAVSDSAGIVIKIKTYEITLSSLDDKNFGSVEYGYEAPQAYSVTITNTGNQPTGDLSVTISGTNADSFILSTSAISSIAPNDDNSFTVAPGVDLAKGDYTAAVTVSGDNGITAGFNVSFKVGASSVTDIAVKVTAPSKGSTPVTTALTDDTGYICGAVSWSPVPDHNQFQGGVKYTATVTLTVEGNYTFAEELSAVINGKAADVLNKSDSSVTLSHQFAETLLKSVASIVFTSHPSKLIYSHGDTLDLSGLVAKLTYDDGTSESIAFSESETFFDTANSAHGAELSHLVHNDQPVEISHGGETANTHKLIVVSWPAELTAVYGQSLSDISLASYTNGGTGAFTWDAPSDLVGSVGTQSHSMTFTPNNTAIYSTLTQSVNITVNKTGTVIWPAGLTAIYGQSLSDIPLASYTNSDTGVFTWTTPSSPVGSAGTRSHNMTFTPYDTDNFDTLKQDVSIIVNKADPTVTWPVGIGISYGQTLANISLSGRVNNGVPAGTFTWTTPDASVGIVGTQSHSMTFTPNDTANYNTLTQNVNITVVKAYPTVTWPTGLTATYGQTLSDISLSGKGTSSTAGVFSWNAPSTSVGNAGTHGHVMAFTPTDTTNYNTLMNGVGVTVNKANPTVTWPTGITTPYGRTLSDISLSGKGTSTPAGTFTWTTPSTSVGALGTRSFSMTFTPTDTANYNTLTNNVSVTVNKAMAVMYWPTGLTATYGQILSDIPLPYNAGTPGTFTWDTPSASVGSIGTNYHSMTFTPLDTVNYYIEQTINGISVTVKKINPTVTWPTRATIFKGESLAKAVFTGGSANVAGTFAYTNPGIVPAEWESGTAYTVSFTPTNTAIYSTLTQGVNVNINIRGVSVESVEMVRVVAGDFLMGSASGGDSDERPVRTVILTGFYIGKYEVTQEQYQAVMGNNPSSSYGVGANYPVYNVSWYDALVFCNKLSIREGLSPAYRINNSTDPAAWGSVPGSDNVTWNAVTIVEGSTGYRLPTEAQWEYAAKGGDPTAAGWVGYTYAGSDTANEVAWYSGNNEPYGSKPVGTKSPNGLGIYDMSGNVDEWCWDWRGDYTSEDKTDPTGASSGSLRVLRGGGWSNIAEDVRSALRLSVSPSGRGYDFGFRVVRPAQ